MENAQYNVAINILIMENICLFIKILILRLHHWYRLPKENTLSYINIVTVRACQVASVVSYSSRH